MEAFRVVLEDESDEVFLDSVKKHDETRTHSALK